MSDKATTAERYRRKADECVALAKSAISNEVRALHYAMAERYLRLAEDETKKNDVKPTRDRVRARANVATASRRREAPIVDASSAIYDKTG